MLFAYMLRLVGRVYLGRRCLLLGEDLVLKL